MPRQPWPPEMLALPPRKCKKCKVEKVITDFPRNRTSPGGVYEVCMECYKASRGTRSNGQSDTRFTARSEHVRASPTSSRALHVEPPKIPSGIEVVELKRLSQLPRELCIERRPEEVNDMLRRLELMKQKVKIIYTFKNRLGVKYFIFLVPEEVPQEQPAKKTRKK